MKRPINRLCMRCCKVDRGRWNRRAGRDMISEYISRPRLVREAETMLD